MGALSLGFVIGGAIVVEVVFSYPGLSSPHVPGARLAGLPDAAGAVLFFTLAILFSNLVADLLYSWFDPAREGGVGVRDEAFHLPRPPWLRAIEGARSRAPPARVLAVLGHVPQEQGGDRGTGYPAAVHLDGDLRALLATRAVDVTGQRPHPGAALVGVPAGDRRSRRSVLTLVIWGSLDLPVVRAPRRSSR
jgi:hypothetical protein